MEQDTLQRWFSVFYGLSLKGVRTVPYLLNLQFEFFHWRILRAQMFEFVLFLKKAENNCSLTYNKIYGPFQC